MRGLWVRLPSLALFMTQILPLKGSSRAKSADIISAYWHHHCRSLAQSTRDRRNPSWIRLPVVRYHGRQTKAAPRFGVVAAAYPSAGPTYQNTLITAVKGYFEWAEGIGLIESNPIRELKKPRPKVRQEFLPHVKWQALLEAATDQQFRDFLVFMLATGCRPQEITKIEGRHFTGDRIEFPPEESKGRQETRVILLPGESREIVERLAAKWTSVSIFRNRRDRPWKRFAVRDRFNRLKVVLDEPKLCATVLRHSYCHHRLASGQPDHVVAILMGHRSTQMVQLRYGHLAKATEFLKKKRNVTPTSPQPVHKPAAGAWGAGAWTYYSARVVTGSS